MAALEQDGFIIKDDAALAEVAIVNTCGFIEAAKREAIEEILELAKLKSEGRIKKIVVTGCLAERYQSEIHNEIPEVDAVFGIGANGEIASNIRRLFPDSYIESFPDKLQMPICGPRIPLTPSYFGYIKIAEGCSNHCTYCAIPSIRGAFRSRPIEEVAEEAEAMVRDGARELILVAQDTTRYGIDLYGEYALAKLLRRLCRIDGLCWLRILYCYPEAITDELLSVIAEEDKIVKYLDLPLQHVSADILKRMNRSGSCESLSALIEKIRTAIPGITLRTTLITGFPGETEEDFTQLHHFIKKIRFDHLGCFSYSQEEGTPAASLPDQIDEATKLRRAELITDTQMDIHQENGEALIGQAFSVLVEGFDRYAECWFGRTKMDAPDIDGKLFFTADSTKPILGSIVTVEVEDCIDGDLFGCMLT